MTLDIQEGQYAHYGPRTFHQQRMLTALRLRVGVKLTIPEYNYDLKPETIAKLKPSLEVESIEPGRIIFQQCDWALSGSDLRQYLTELAQNTNCVMCFKRHKIPGSRPINVFPDGQAKYEDGTPVQKDDQFNPFGSA